MATTIEVKPETATLTNDEILRYSRHLIMPEVGMEGQQKLKAARVLCIGAGGLGSPLALYLAAAGVGTLGIVDFDVVDFTNLQRQIIHSTADVGRKKLDSAAEKLKAINPFVNVRKFETRLSSSANSTSSPTAPTISRRATSSTTPAYSRESPTSTDRFFASKARLASSRPKTVRAIAACILNRHRRDWSHPARKVECSAYYPGSSA